MTKKKVAPTAAPDLPSLPKWSEIRVLGKNITKEQAAIMAVRLTSLYFSSNDADVNDMISRAWYGIPLQEGKTRGFDMDNDAFVHYLGKDPKEEIWCHEFAKEVARHYGVLAIDDIRASLITSSWVGGPHAWFRLDGEMRNTHAYNVGKWPDALSVFDEWRIVASAFPFLDLRCQLFDAEEGEAGKPVVEYVVANGKVTIVPVGKPLPQSPEADFDLSLSIHESAFQPQDLEAAMQLTTASLDVSRWPDFVTIAKSVYANELKRSRKWKAEQKREAKLAAEVKA